MITLERSCWLSKKVRGTLLLLSYSYDQTKPPNRPLLALSSGPRPRFRAPELWRRLWILLEYHLPCDSLDLVPRLARTYICCSNASHISNRGTSVARLSPSLCLGGVSMGLHEVRRKWERKENAEADALYAGGVGEMV